MINIITNDIIKQFFLNVLIIIIKEFFGFKLIFL